MKKTKITYNQVGDNYDTKDPILRSILKTAQSTLSNMDKKFTAVAETLGGSGLKTTHSTISNMNRKFTAVAETLGGSAFAWDQGNCYMASVLECLGTKNLVADEMRKITGKTYYDIIAQDTVATFVNDLSTLGAKPLVISAYWALEDNSWLEDRLRMHDFLKGWKNACDLAGCAWGGGETPTLKGIIEKDTVDLAGSAVGIIEPKHRLVSEHKLSNGDRIIVLRSNGLNANGISLARAVGRKLDNSFATKIPGGKMYGEAILTPSNIYADVIQILLNNEINIHYIVNITGHGLRKIMRAKKEFTYVLEKIFEPQEIFLFIQKYAGLTDYEIYQTYNMGMDYAIFVSEKDAHKTLSILAKQGKPAIDAGFVENGERRVVIKKKKIIYQSESYLIRN
jgi:phosphoribosylformylglycinamidine cyclo-ligase